MTRPYPSSRSPGHTPHSLVSFFLEPYAHLTNEETVTQVTAGYRLPRPHNCPHAVYDIMMSTWASVPENRPSFREIHEKLQEVQVQAQQGSEGTYYTVLSDNNDSNSNSNARNFDSNDNQNSLNISLSNNDTNNNDSHTNNTHTNYGIDPTSQ